MSGVSQRCWIFLVIAIASLVTVQSKRISSDASVGKMDTQTQELEQDRKQISVSQNKAAAAQFGDDGQMSEGNTGTGQDSAAEATAASGGDDGQAAEGNIGTGEDSAEQATAASVGDDGQVAEGNIGIREDSAEQATGASVGDDGKIAKGSASDSGSGSDSDSGSGSGSDSDSGSGLASDSGSDSSSGSGSDSGSGSNSPVCCCGYDWDEDKTYGLWKRFKESYTGASDWTTLWGRRKQEAYDHFDKKKCKKMCKEKSKEKTYYCVSKFLGSDGQTSCPTDGTPPYDIGNLEYTAKTDFACFSTEKKTSLLNW